MNPAQHEAEIRELDRLAREQAALRRVATLVASGAPAEQVFASVAEEAGRLLLVDAVALSRYEPDEMFTPLAIWSTTGDAPAVLGSQHKLGGPNTSTRVWETGRAARIDQYGAATGSIADAIRHVGVRSAVGTPISVDGRLWGVIQAASARERRLPGDTEARLANFTELVATAIANAESGAALVRLAEEQAALRRVATLVARGVAPEGVFAQVAEEVGLLLGAEGAVIHRFEADGGTTVVGSWGSGIRVGTRCEGHGDDVAALVHRTQQSVRLDDLEIGPRSIASSAPKAGLRSAVGSPIVTDGRLWGAIVAATSRAEPMPAGAEPRIAQFTKLVATAISNIHARTEERRLSDQQAALRRVATIVARECSPEEVFVKVAEEVGILLGADSGSISRFEPDGYCTVLGSWGKLRDAFNIGSRWKLDGDSVTASVHRTGRPVRLDSYERGSGSMAAAARGAGVHSSVAGPIVINGRLWGALVAATEQAEPMASAAESQVAQFAELVATSISNAQAQSDLAASRARIAAATDEERRRVVRDLHDGAQRRLVHTIATIDSARRALERDGEATAELVDDAIESAQAATEELRELAHGILPSALTQEGLSAGISALTSRMSIPVETAVSVGRLAPEIEASAYFVVAEALKHVATRSSAQRAWVTARLDHATLLVEVRDDGTAGAQALETGLVGLRDRLAVLDGTLWVETPAARGTVVAATIPIR